MFATEDELARARAAGRAAYYADRPKAPGADATIRAMLVGLPVGTRKTIDVMQAFIDGYDEEIEIEVDVQMAGCEGHESLNGADMGVTVYCDGSCR
jgi:hypothetical protein